MRKLSGTLGAVAALAVAAPLVAAAQQVPTGVATDRPGSDRAGKTRRADAPPPDPTPAAGTRLGRDVTTPG
ncbi:MAG: hypothetical protein LC745_08990, partial [Planctomycetia bacterium]|nr:hypothetical protein [Planctomycetia bacterium]